MKVSNLKTKLLTKKFIALALAGAFALGGFALTNLPESIANAAAKSAQNFDCPTMPVSYTHLDVYKRQATLLRLHPNHRPHLRRLALVRVTPPALGVTDFRGVTGGVYKARERIHRSMLTCDY